MKKLFDDIKSARWAIILIIAYFVFLNKFIYTICPIVLFTGYPCPGCGMTRAMFRVLHLDFLGAWKMHPFIYPVIILGMWFAIERYMIKKSNMKRWFHAVVVIAIAMVIFYVWRMHIYFPNEAPMNYYNGSVLGKIKRIVSMY